MTLELGLEIIVASVALFGLVGSIITAAIKYGTLQQRVKSLEDDHDDTKADVHEIMTEVKEISKVVHRIDGRLGNASQK